MNQPKKSSNIENYRKMYLQMQRIRVFEDKANELYLSAKMPGLTHMYSGQEAVAVGICEALKKTDYITSTHRGHGHCIAKGASYKEMFCELLGKEMGYWLRHSQNTTFVYSLCFSCSLLKIINSPKKS